MRGVPCHAIISQLAARHVTFPSFTFLMFPLSTFQPQNELKAGTVAADSTTKLNKAKSHASISHLIYTLNGKITISNDIKRLRWKQATQRSQSHKSIIQPIKKSRMSQKHHSNHYLPPPKHRQSIRQQSTPSSSSKRLSPAWKDALKQRCLQRARQKRNNRIALSRSSSAAIPTTKPNAPLSNNSSTMYNNEGNDEMMMMQSSTTAECGEDARSWIQEHLHATGIAVMPSTSNNTSTTYTPSSSYHYGQNTNPYQDQCQYTTPPTGRGPILPDVGAGLSSSGRTNLFPRDHHCITEQEYLDLIYEIEQELQYEYGKTSLLQPTSNSDNNKIYE